MTSAFSIFYCLSLGHQALHFAYYNFCRIRSSIRVTPAMEAALTDHVWNITELLS